MYITDYPATDSEAMNRKLYLFLDGYLLGFNERSVNSNCKLFKEKVTYLTEAFVPLRLATTNTLAPWYSPSLERLANKNKCCFGPLKLSIPKPDGIASTLLMLNTERP